MEKEIENTAAAIIALLNDKDDIVKQGILAFLLNKYANESDNPKGYVGTVLFVLKKMNKKTQQG